MKSLTGMNSLEQMTDNMQDVEPLSQEERAIVLETADMIRSRIAIACTGCRYCTSYCPKGIPIPDYFGMYNDLWRNPEEDWKIGPVYDETARSHAKASECIGCGSCERHCPQKLEISKLMQDVAAKFDVG